MTFISYSNGITLIYRILRPFTIHLLHENMLILDMMVADYDDGFSVQRSSIISTDFPKHLLSIAKNIVVCNKTWNIGAVAEWCSLYRGRSGAAHLTWCRHHGDGQGRRSRLIFVCKADLHILMLYFSLLVYLVQNLTLNNYL